MLPAERTGNQGPADPHQMGVPANPVRQPGTAQHPAGTFSRQPRTRLRKTLHTTCGNTGANCAAKSKTTHPGCATYLITEPGMAIGSNQTTTRCTDHSSGVSVRRGPPGWRSPRQAPPHSEVLFMSRRRTTPCGRLALARCVVDDGWSLRRAAERFQISPQMAGALPHSAARRRSG
jgi:hypothetical protein